VAELIGRDRAEKRVANGPSATVFPMRTAESELKILHDGASERELMARRIAELQPIGNDPIRILEAGCGQRWPIHVAGRPIHLTGIDTDAEAMRIRKESQGDLDVGIVADLRTVDLPADSFDIVYCSFVLEHVDGAENVLDRLVHATRPGGRLIIRVPDGKSVYGWFVRRSPHRVHVWWKRYVEGFENAGKPGHAPYPTVYDKVVSREGLVDYAARNNLAVVDIYGSNSYLRVFRRARRIAEMGIRVTAWLSRGRLAATHNNIGVVLQKANQPILGRT
jgi:SAM-dependent methyltransferase